MLYTKTKSGQKRPHNLKIKEKKKVLQLFELREKKIRTNGICFCIALYEKLL